MARSRSQRSGFEQRLLHSLRTLGVTQEMKLVVGFSGGCDSLALATSLSRVSKVMDLQIKLVHVDHQLRPDSARDIQRCRELASALSLSFESRVLAPGLAQRCTGIGLEEGARRERYLALAAASAEWGAEALALAHQANDQAETILLHLVRGAGLDGLSGMRPREFREIPWWDSDSEPRRGFLILRPLLHETRKSIEEYVMSNGMIPVIDPSNESLDFDRNWMRHRVMPEIVDRWPAAVGSMQRAALPLQYDREDLDNRATALIRDSLESDHSLRIAVLRESTPAIAFRTIRMWIKEIGHADAGFDVVARIYGLLESGDEARLIEVGSRISVVKEDTRLTTLSSLESRFGQTAPLVATNGVLGWSVTIEDGDGEADAAIRVPRGEELTVRQLNAGDRWWRTTRSVFDDLRGAGVHPLLRDKLLAVVSDDGVMLIPAIYPTMHGAELTGPVRSLRIRWRKQS